MATGDLVVASIVFDGGDDYLTFPLKGMGLLTLFNGIDMLQNVITSRF